MFSIFTTIFSIKISFVLLLFFKMSLHILFFREHNRLARLIDEFQPSLSNEQVFQRARMLVVALHWGWKWKAVVGWRIDLGF